MKFDLLVLKLGRKKVGTMQASVNSLWRFGVRSTLGLGALRLSGSVASATDWKGQSLTVIPGYWFAHRAFYPEAPIVD